MALIPVAAQQRVAARLAGDPIELTGHGVLFGPDGRQITVTVNFVRRTQALYLAHLAQGLSPAQRAQLEQKQRYLADIGMGDPQDALYANALLIESLARDAAGPGVTLIADHNEMLQYQLQRRLPLAAGERRPGSADIDYAPSEALRAQLRQLGLAESASAATAATPPVDAVPPPTYEQECLAAGVPTPPDWGKQVGGVDVWVSQGNLATLFEADNLAAELFKWESATPPGVCLALPRYDATAPPPFASRLFGIICMGTKAQPSSPGIADKTSNACFWDWQGQRVKVKLRGEMMPLSRFAAAPNFKDNAGGICSDCHAGENSFVVHYEDPAFANITGNFVPETWHFPKVKGGWPLNPGPKNLMKGVALPMGESSCGGRCHYRTANGATAARLPDVSMLPGYCAAVLDRAVRRTMPEAHAGGMPDPAYKTHIRLLYAACRLPAPVFP